jgi:hypothetical protein
VRPSWRSGGRRRAQAAGGGAEARADDLAVRDALMRLYDAVG